MYSPIICHYASCYYPFHVIKGTHTGIQYGTRHPTMYMNKTVHTQILLLGIIHDHNPSNK